MGESWKNEQSLSGLMGQYLKINIYVSEVHKKEEKNQYRKFKKQWIKIFKIWCKKIEDTKIWWDLTRIYTKKTIFQYIIIILLKTKNEGKKSWNQLEESNTLHTENTNLIDLRFFIRNHKGQKTVEKYVWCAKRE